MTTPSPAELAERRATVAELSHDGASLRVIAEELGISKDTVRRDLKALERDSMRQPDQQHETPTRDRATADATSPATRVAQRASEADHAMRHLATAVSTALGARPSHVIVSHTVARQWADQLTTHAAQLVKLAEQFEEYYPATAAGA